MHGHWSPPFRWLRCGLGGPFPGVLRDQYLVTTIVLVEVIQPVTKALLLLLDGFIMCFPYVGLTNPAAWRPVHTLDLFAKAVLQPVPSLIACLPLAAVDEFVNLPRQLRAGVFRLHWAGLDNTTHGVPL